MKIKKLHLAMGLALLPLAAASPAQDQGKGNSTGLDIPSGGVPACVISNGKAPSKNPHCTADNDNDGTPNYLDAFPADPTEWKDSDLDGVGDNADPFDDDPTEWADTDGDGRGDNSDACPTTAGTGPDGCPVITEVVGTDLVSTFDEWGVVSAITKILGDGQGGVYSNTVQGTGQYFATDITIKDFDGDSINDVIVLFKGDNRNCYPHSSPNLTLYKNDGAGNLTLQSSIAIQNFCPTNSWAWGALAAEDFNGDGKLDYAMPRAHHVSFLISNGSGGHTQQHLGAGGGRSITSADFDNDGDLDVVTHQANGWGGFYYFTNNGNGTFSGPAHFGSSELPIGAVAGDYNGDGNIDVATGGYTRELAIYYGNGNGTFQNVPLPPSSIGSGAARFTSDLDGDGSLDVVVTTGAQVVVYFNDGNGNFTADRYTMPYGIYDVELVDFDEDGIKDLAMTVASNRILVLLGTGNGNFGSVLQIPTSRIQHSLDSGNLD